MINKTALINQHIYENGLYLSEDRRAEIRHKSESKSGNLVESRRKIKQKKAMDKAARAAIRGHEERAVK
ncbi:hypothetical protein PPACK8108_LOCUS19965 [Phakopsora pachyrhizi]|uniref:Uncharacterized protein n=1 Tax=Phakopsora pachyrhizi TaxID=170000 RepID=A0AAV0BE42_PHAPC|nr:hypothetical protein PPACK8108_LOCUS19965 [Phakopsora pachyrhizi]